MSETHSLFLTSLPVSFVTVTRIELQLNSPLIYNHPLLHRSVAVDDVVCVTNDPILHSLHRLATALHCTVTPASAAAGHGTKSWLWPTVVLGLRPNLAQCPELGPVSSLELLTVPFHPIL